jgi:hypothetical protein
MSKFEKGEAYEVNWKRERHGSPEAPIYDIFESETEVYSPSGNASQAVKQYNFKQKRLTEDQIISFKKLSPDDENYPVRKRALETPLPESPKAQGGRTRRRRIRKSRRAHKKRK